MFQSEMENLELGLDLGSSDLLFPDDLFNVPLDQLQAQQQDADLRHLAAAESEQQQPDLLQQVIDEIKMAPMEIKVEQQNTSGDTNFSSSSNDVSNDTDAEMKSVLADYNDLLFEEPVQLAETSVNVTAVASPGSETDDTQSLIEEMEEFLNYHEGGESSVQNTIEDAPMREKPTVSISASSSPLNDADTEQAEQIVQALVSGDLTLDTYSQERQRQLAQQTGHGANAIGATISNISEITTEDGNTIVIVIANDDAATTATASPVLAAASPSPSSSYAASSVGVASPAPVEDTDDSDWTPDSPVVAKKRTSARAAAAAKSSSSPMKGVAKRGPYKQRSSLSSKYNVRDKKERKKMQNVVAARRYRDKKKGEQADIEQVEEELAEKNTELKDRLREMENEVKTLKKLMVELGLVKVSQATAASLS